MISINNVRKIFLMTLMVLEIIIIYCERIIQYRYIINNNSMVYSYTDI